MIAHDVPAHAHRRALLLMIVAPLLWSTAGVVTRWLSPELQAHGRFEITFWRSLFAALTVAAYMTFARDDVRFSLSRLDRTTVLSGFMWCTMYVAFMLALTRTTVANTLVVLSVQPLLTALLAWIVLRRPLSARTGLAIAVAMAGIGWMFADGVNAGGGTHLVGMLIALAVPLAAAINLVTLEKRGAHVDLIPAVLLGGAFSALLMLPFALPFQARPADVAWLAALGIFQLGVPCMLLVAAARHLSATEISLLALLEVLFGPVWAWLGAGEVPSSTTLYGGALVLGALVFNELALKPRAAPVR
jgi:drug/metabolite transporter (DMT)-like permease